MKRIFFLFHLLIIVSYLHAQHQIDSITNCCPGNTFSETEEGTNASFPNGQIAYRRWLEKWLGSRFNKQLIEENALQGKCTFKLTVDTSGKIAEIEFCSMKNTIAEKVVRDIFSKSPLWNPAFSKSRGKISQSFCQTIFFEFGKKEE